LRPSPNPGRENSLRIFSHQLREKKKGSPVGWGERGPRLLLFRKWGKKRAEGKKKRKHFDKLRVGKRRKRGEGGGRWLCFFLVEGLLDSKEEGEKGRDNPLRLGR